MPDFTLANHGSICVLTPQTKEARDWADHFLPEDAMQWAGGTVIEPRYVDDIICGIEAAGLEVT